MEEKVGDIRSYQCVCQDAQQFNLGIYGLVPENEPTGDNAAENQQDIYNMRCRKRRDGNAGVEMGHLKQFYEKLHG